MDFLNVDGEVRPADGIPLIDSFGRLAVRCPIGVLCNVL